jgi:hypothetical protein
MTELGEPDVMGPHRVRQDACFDFVSDLGIVSGITGPMTRLILDHLEVDDFEQDRNPGIESDIHEHAERSDGGDSSLDTGPTGECLLEFIPFLLAR